MVVFTIGLELTAEIMEIVFASLLCFDFRKCELGTKRKMNFVRIPARSLAMFRFQFLISRVAFGN